MIDDDEENDERRRGLGLGSGLRRRKEEAVLGLFLSLVSVQLLTCSPMILKEAFQ